MYDGMILIRLCRQHDDVIKWKHFPRYWPFVRGIHRSPVNSPHKGQWRGALVFSLICVWINGWVNNREAGDLRRYRAHYDVIVMKSVGSVASVVAGATETYHRTLHWHHSVQCIYANIDNGQHKPELFNAKWVNKCFQIHISCILQIKIYITLIKTHFRCAVIERLLAKILWRLIDRSGINKNVRNGYNDAQRMLINGIHLTSSFFTA